MIEKKEHKIKRWTEAEKDKTSKKFWNLINEQGKRKEKISKNIKMTEWVEHFKKQMNGDEKEGTHRSDQEEAEKRQEEIKEEVDEISREEIKKPPRK